MGLTDGLQGTQALGQTCLSVFQGMRSTMTAHRQHQTAQTLRGMCFDLLQVVMTFTLISVVYACGVAKPGHGSFTPLVVGLSLTACAATGGKYTGAALNPARVLGVWHEHRTAIC